MSKIEHMARVMRPVNLVLTAVSVWIGYWFASGNVVSFNAVIAAISAALVCAGGNIFNDYCDIQIDRVNRPDRPYAAGFLNRIDMIGSGIAVFSAGLLLSILLGSNAVSVVIATIILLMFYNYYAKRAVLLGNLIISFLTGLAFIYGAVAAGNAPGAVIPALFAALYHFGREILKDIEDIEGDKQQGVRTFPLRYGIEPALKLAAATFLLLIIFTVIPFLFLGYGLTYFIIVFAGVDMLIVIVFYRYIFFRDVKRLRQMNEILKIGMFIGLLALMLK